ncbi:mitochondrial small ribosomal subunit Rsm22-domain-containing protein [Phlebopus sp. FC_14]|nr:mitochondrial small ribosomal subunit Rsm22-domain-containing protein [Phlebopus sp. FC_14]
MIRGVRASLGVVARYARPGFSSSANLHSVQPNPSLILDPSLKTLLQDVDLSVTRHKHGKNVVPRPRPSRELEALTNDEGDVEYHEMDVEDYSPNELMQRRLARKSPAARFGSNQIGAVILPPELQRSVLALIQASDKTLLHSDAKRLFQGDGAESWDTAYGVKYKSREQSHRHSLRDGTAFASVILPAHYSAIFAVLHHVKYRLGESWKVEKVFDWGAGTGSGLWAALYAFQKTPIVGEDGPHLSKSNVVSYVGIDKREGLVSIGKQLLRQTKSGTLNVAWKKSFHESDRVDLREGHDTLAISAFMLSTLPTTLARKAMVKEIWESGAHTIIFIDHASPVGFESIAEARTLLLEMGRREMEDPETEDCPVRGSHVIAPCPHDHPCPLHHPGSSRLVCGFSQRLQRPTFVRRTKHAREGHEDIQYSYVVVRRGPKPMTVAGQPVGRMGGVGLESLQREVNARTVVPRELERADVPHEHHSHQQYDHPRSPLPPYTSSNTEPELCESEGTFQTASDLEETLRREAYGWPRLVFPPLKRSGHIIIDACTQEGKIMRLTVPKSQGKQAFYDARKSSWGDIFPHPPKNKPVERYQAPPKNGKKAKDVTSGQVSDIGKRPKGRDKKGEEKSYAALAEKMKEEQKAKWKASRRDSVAAIRFGDEGEDW